MARRSAQLEEKHANVLQAWNNGKHEETYRLSPFEKALHMADHSPYPVTKICKFIGINRQALYRARIARDKGHVVGKTETH